MASGAKARAGTAWLTRRVDGFVWGRAEQDLKYLANPADLAKLVLLDQWTRNCDRYRPQPLRVNPNNVFLMREGAPRGRFILVAMDHTHIFTCGRRLTRDLAKIDFVRDNTAFGLFPEFSKAIQHADAVAAVVALEGISNESIQGVVDSIPQDWEVKAPVSTAIREFLMQLRDWLAKEFVTGLFPQRELF